MNAKYEKSIINPAVTVATLNTMKILLIETKAAQQDNQLQVKMSSQNVELVHVADTAENLVDKIQIFAPDVLVLSVDFLDAFMLDQLIKINQSNPLPVTVFAKQHAPEVLKMVVSAGVSSYVVDDVQEHRLPIIVDLARVRFEQMHTLSTELEKAKEKLSDRKIIERAKGIIMQQKRLSEEEAYVQMRKSAMNQGQSIAEISRRVISVFDMLD